MTLVFDLDGTLTDPAVGIARSINYALEAHGFAKMPESAASQYIGPPLDESFRAMTGATSHHLIDALVAKYRERYGEIGFAENTLYAGIPEALTSLAQRGCVLGVCTSKRADFAEKILHLFQLRGYFSFVSGGDTGIQKTLQLRGLLASGLVQPGSTMIGDRAVDVTAARENGLRSVGVLWGHGSLDELQGAGADHIISLVQELASLRDLSAAPRRLP